MVTRQRRGRSRQSNGSATVIDAKDGLSRRTWLLSILAITTALFIALQVSRYNDSNSATGRFLSSALGQSSDLGGLKGRTGQGNDPLQLEALTRRLSLLSKQFKSEFKAVADGKKELEPKQQDTSSLKMGQKTGAGMAVVPGEVTKDIPLENVPYVEGKSREEALEDQKVALQDLDQDTLKAMFDLLYARD